LPFVLRNSSRFPLVSQVRNTIPILSQLVLVSLSLFFMAHALLLKIFFPTRYTVHTLRIVMALAAGIAIVSMVDAIFYMWIRMARSHRMGQLILTTTAAVSIGIVLILYPHLTKNFPATNNRISNENSLYEFLQKQPQDSLIATISDQAENIPIFAQRPILIAREYALPFHLGYYNQVRQRCSELIRAQYSQNLALAQQLIQKYNVHFWLLDRKAFTAEYLTDKSWLKSFQPAFTESLTNLEQGIDPALAKLLKSKRCSVLETQNLVVLEASCIVDFPSLPPSATQDQ